ncbi:hypothetical protein D3C73_1506790 [compost metagenome]
MLLLQQLHALMNQSDPGTGSSAKRISFLLAFGLHIEACPDLVHRLDIQAPLPAESALAVHFHPCLKQ